MKNIFFINLLIILTFIACVYSTYHQKFRKEIKFVIYVVLFIFFVIMLSSCGKIHEDINYKYIDKLYGSDKNCYIQKTNIFRGSTVKSCYSVVLVPSVLDGKFKVYCPVIRKNSDEAWIENPIGMYCEEE